MSNLNVRSAVGSAVGSDSDSDVKLDMAWYEAAFGIFEILVIMVIEGIWVIMRFKKQ